MRHFTTRHLTAAAPGGAPANRRGVLTAWSISGLLISGACTALVINHLWISGVRHDSLRCAEAAALAAGHGLLSDEMLRTRQQPFEKAGRRERSITAAVEVSRLYHQTSPAPILSAANILHSDRATDSPISLGSNESGQSNPDSLPESILVSYGADDQRFRIPLFFSGTTGLRDAAIGVSAEASIEHHPIGFRAGRASIPMMPLAIPDDPLRTGVPSWTEMIENSRGADRFSWNADQESVENGPDGLPEITLTFRSGQSDAAFGRLVPLRISGQSDRPATLRQQIAGGITSADLTHTSDSSIRFPCSFEMSQTTAPEISEIADCLGAATGRGTIFCLCEAVGAVSDSDSKVAEATDSGDAENDVGPTNGILRNSTDVESSGTEQPADSVRLTRPIAARIVYVRMSGDDSFEVTLQPCVLVTSTAMMDATVSDAASRYVYSVRLIR